MVGPTNRAHKAVHGHTHTHGAAAHARAHQSLSLARRLNMHALASPARPHTATTQQPTRASVSLARRHLRAALLQKCPPHIPWRALQLYTLMSGLPCAPPFALPHCTLVSAARDLNITCLSAPRPSVTSPHVFVGPRGRHSNTSRAVEAECYYWPGQFSSTLVTSQRTDPGPNRYKYEYR